ncbi:MAG: hypothetical protein ACQEW8_01340 [Actinomycetota bacterium]
MSRNGTLSQSARGRIRAFSALTGVIGVALIGGLAFLSLTQPGASLGGPPVATDGDFYYPWENPDPLISEQDGDTWSGDGQAVIRLRGLNPGDPLRLEYDLDGPVRGVYLTAPGGGVPDGATTQPDFTTYDGPLHVIPGQSDVDVWVRAREAGAWSLTIEDAALTERTGTVSGIGPETFLYTGDATTARITARGDYGTSIDIVTARGEESLFSSYDGEESSVAWADSPTVIFTVDNYGDSAWTIDFHETDDDE